MLEQIIDIIAPHECLQCNSEGSMLCDTCATLLPRPLNECYKCKTTSQNGLVCKKCATSFHSLYAVTLYQDNAKDLVHKLKFGRAKAAARVIARTICVRTPLPADALFAAVPTASRRIRARGYDQSVLIAREVAALNKGVYVSLLARAGKQRQVGQSRKQRLSQMNHAFRATRKRVPADRPIILIDDVLTTGSTLDAAAKELQRAGYRDITAVVFAIA